MKSFDQLGRMALIATNVVLLLNALIGLAGLIVTATQTGALSIGIATQIERVLFLGVILAFTLIRLPARNTSNWSNRLVAIAGSYLTLAIPFFPYSPTPDFSTVTGVLVTAVGLGLCCWALAFLGRSFSVDATARKLVTNGPYRLVRHPLYLAEGVVLVGLLLTNLSWFTVALVVANLLLQYWRILNEERVLRAAFADYAEYALNVPQLVPFVIGPKTVRAG